MKQPNWPLDGASQRIADGRTAELTVVVTDAQGQPLAGRMFRV